MGPLYCGAPEKSVWSSLCFSLIRNARLMPKVPGPVNSGDPPMGNS